MASREETLLFIVDVSVRNAQALRQLDADLDAAAANQRRRLLALQDVANGGGGGNGGGGNGALPGASGMGVLHGTRGPVRPGSRENPVTTAEEAGQYAGLGGMAAASGATPSGSAAAAAVPNGNGNGNGNAPNPVPVPSSAARTLDDQAQRREDDRVIQAVQTGLSFRRDLEASRPSHAGPLLTNPAAGTSPSYALGGAGIPFARDLAAARGAQTARMLNSAEAADRLGVNRSQLYQLAGAGKLPGAQKQGGQWQIPEDAVMQLLAGGGGSHGGGPRLPGTGGSGGGKGGGFLGKLLWGEGAHLPFTGIGNFAGMGSLGSFAGLGPEHIVVTGLGLAGSLTSGLLAGGALKAAGSLGPLAVGGGADMLANKTTLDNAKALNQYVVALQTAVTKYGADSKQAAAAQAQLNSQLKAMNGVGAEVTLDRNADAVKALYMTMSKGAQTQAADVMNQVVMLAKSYVPLITEAAERNLSIVNQGLEPLFAWLEGPTGMGVIQDLENEFARNLPNSIAAFDQGLELLLRIMDLAGQHAGGLAKDLDNLFTRLNGESNQQLGGWIDKELQNLHDWMQLFDYLLKDIAAAFHEDKGTADAIVVSLTNMLKELNKWENSTQGKSQLSDIFTVHKNETLQLLKLLPELTKGFGSLYLDVAPALTTAFTGVVKILNSLLEGIDSLGPAGKLALGLTLVAAKLKLLVPGLKALGALTGLTKALQGLPGIGKLFGGTSGIMGIRGPAAPGSAANPIAVTGMGTGPNVPGGNVAKDAEEGAGGAGVIAGLKRLLGVGETAGTEGDVMLAGMPSAAELAALLVNPTVLVALGTSAAAVYGVVKGLQAINPDKTLPTPQVIANLTPTPLTNPYNPLRRVHGNFGTTAAGAVGGPADSQPMDKSTQAFLQQNYQKYLAGATQQQAAPPSASTNDAAFAKMLASNVNTTGIKQTTTALSQLAAQAKQLNDTKWSFGAKLGAELLTTQSVASKGVQQLIAQFAKLPPGVQAQTGAAMISMAKQLQAQGALPEAQVKALTSDIQGIVGKSFDQVVSTVSAHMLSMRHSIATGGVGAVQDLQLSMTQFVSTIQTAMQDGVINASTGSQLIQKAVTAELKALGVTVTPRAVGTATLAAEGQWKTLGAAYGGPPAQHYSGGKITTPTYMVGEEAPAHHEYVLATNPAYRDRNVGLWAAAGRDLGVPGFAKGGTPGSLQSIPLTSGESWLPLLVGGTLNQVVKAANAYIGAQAPRSAGGGAGGGKLVSGAGVPSGTWLQVASALAKLHGWDAAQLQAWWGIEQIEDASLSLTATNPTSGAYGLAQMNTGGGVGPAMQKYYEYGGNPNTIVGQLTAMANYIAEAYGVPSAALAEEAHGGYATGGIAGIPILSSSERAFIASNKGKPKKKTPAPKKNTPLPARAGPDWQRGLQEWYGSLGIVGANGPLPFETADLPPISAQLNTIFGLDGGQGGTIGASGAFAGDAGKMSSLISWYTTLWGAGQPSVAGASDTFSSYGSPSAFVITTDANGNTVTPYISPNLPTVLQELGGPGTPNIIAYQTELLGDLTSALADSQGLVGAKGSLQTAINRRVAEVAKIKKRIQDNVKKIKQLQAQIAAEKKKKKPYANPSNAAQRAANTAFTKTQSSSIAAWNKQITSLEAENQQLGGSKDSVGTGGELATIQGQLGASGGVGALQSAEGATGSASGLYALLGNVDSWITQLGATGGDIDQQKLALTGYQQAYNALAPGANAALTAANISQSPTATTNPITGTVGFTYQGQSFAASLGGLMDSATQALQAIGGGLPYAGSFAEGGTIPGPWGKPWLATVHGGEEISGLAPRGSMSSNVTAAVDRLVSALGDHAQTVKENTRAVCANTTATSSTGPAGATVGYTSLASDTMINVGVGG